MKNNFMISANILEPPPFHMGVELFDGIKIFKLIRIISFIVLRTSYWYMRRYDVTKFGYKARHIKFHWRRRKSITILLKTVLKVIL